MKQGDCKITAWSAPLGWAAVSPHPFGQNKRKRNSTACPAHCAKERQQPSDSAEEDDGGGGGGAGGGGASMLGRAELEGIHLERETRAEIGEVVREGERPPRQPELLLLHCRTASDVEPTLGAGRARGADRACRSAPAGHSDRNLLP